MNNHPNRVAGLVRRYEAVSPTSFGGEAGLDVTLLEMVRLRAAQICDSPDCIQIHEENLRRLGEQKKRIEGLAQWRNSFLYTVKERAALSVSEALALNPPGSLSIDRLREVRNHFGEAQLLYLTTTVFAVCDWIYL